VLSEDDRGIQFLCQSFGEEARVVVERFDVTLVASVEKDWSFMVRVVIFVDNVSNLESVILTIL